MKRRTFLRSLGAGFAIAMVPVAFNQVRIQERGLSLSELVAKTLRMREGEVAECIVRNNTLLNHLGGSLHATRLALANEHDIA